MACDFSLEHYRELLDAARAGGYRFAGFDRPPAAGDLILRHDVDLSLEAAVALAEVEAEAGAWSTWFLMTRSVFYNLDSPAGERAIARLRELGGRIAHHAVWPEVDLDERFERVIAWHNPDPEYMTAPIEGRRERDGRRPGSTRSTTARTRTSTGATGARTMSSRAASSSGSSS